MRRSDEAQAQFRRRFTLLNGRVALVLNEPVMGDRPKNPRIFGREKAGPVRSAPEQNRVFHRPKVILLQSGIPIGFTPESFWVCPLGPGSNDGFQ